MYRERFYARVQARVAQEITPMAVQFDGSGRMFCDFGLIGQNGARQLTIYERGQWLALIAKEDANGSEEPRDGTEQAAQRQAEA